MWGSCRSGHLYSQYFTLMYGLENQVLCQVIMNFKVPRSALCVFIIMLPYIQSVIINMQGKYIPKKVFSPTQQMGKHIQLALVQISPKQTHRD